MYQLLDITLTIVHLSIVVFNLFGWIPKRARKAHFISILLTAAAWFLLGIWFGIGYCPITDWQWQVKEKLGETNIPSNFIEYMAEKWTGKNLDSGFVSAITGICFALAACLSVYVNFFLSKRPAKPVPNKLDGMHARKMR